MVKKAQHYTHLIWDWNGTLQNDARLCVDIMNGLLQKREKPTLTLTQYKEIFGFPVKNYYQKVGFDFAHETYESLASEYIAAYNSRSIACDLQINAVHLLKLFAKKGLSQHILSAQEQKPLEEILRYYDVGKYFQHVIGLSDYYAQGKAKNGKILVNKLNAPKDKIVLIGDTTHDYEVARAIGIDCILFSGGHQTKERLSRCGTIVIDNLDELIPIINQAPTQKTISL